MPGNNNKSESNNKNYRSHHFNYGPFLKYIENNNLIDDATVELTKKKLGTISSNGVNNNSNQKMSDSNNFPSDPLGMNTFADQRANAKTKEERDDARHQDLHANVKTKDLTDKDKIFLLRREIDSLNGKVNGGTVSSSSSASGNSSASLFATNLPLLTAFLLFGIVLLSTRFLTRKLRLMRSSDSLLLDGSGIDEAGRNYEYSNANSNEGIVGFELQEHQSSVPSKPQQGGLFSNIASTLDRNSNVATTSPAGQSYRAPEASLQFL